MTAARLATFVAKPRPCPRCSRMTKVSCCHDDSGAPSGNGDLGEGHQASRGIVARRRGHLGPVLRRERRLHLPDPRLVPYLLVTVLLPHRDVGRHAAAELAPILNERLGPPIGEGEQGVARRVALGSAPSARVAARR